MMFQKEYKKAYDEIKAKPESIEQIFARAEGKVSIDKKRKKVWKPVVVTAVLAMALVVGVNIPTLAEELVITAYKTGLIDYTMYKHLQRENMGTFLTFVPKNAAVSKDGVVMTVEEVAFYGTKVVMTISFSNEEGANFINGEKEYNWQDIEVSIAGERIEIDKTNPSKYDAESKKLYGTYIGERHTTSVKKGETIRVCVKNFYTSGEWEESFDLSNIEKNAETRAVKLPVGSFTYDSTIVKTESKEYPYIVDVLNQTPLAEVNQNEVDVTGIAYMDGMLRVQVCQGEYKLNNNIYQNAYVMQFNEEGEEIFPNPNEMVIWYERVDGKLLEFKEFYYVISEEQLKKRPMVVYFEKIEGLINNSVLEVEFEIEE